jgi:signal transduction histidine kinase
MEAGEAIMPVTDSPASDLQRRPRILIVDDSRVNRDLLAAYLEDADYDLSEAESGANAIELASVVSPDIVLLDVMMPGMDGYETTKRLKALSSDFLPVILVTALDDSAARLRGYEAGADEFLTKPVNRHELRARLRNLLQLRFERRALARKNEHLQRLQQFRERATSLLVHDLKNPLGSMSLNIDYATKAIEATGRFPDVIEALLDARSASRRLLRRIAEALDTARGDEGRLVARRSPVRLHELFESATQEFDRAARGRNVSIVRTVTKETNFPLDRDLSQRILENLLENALRYTPEGGRIELTAQGTEDALEILVCNDGPSIDTGLRPRLFERFAQGATSDQGVTRGLGLYFCRLAVEAHAGTIEIVDTPAFATCFRIVIPVSG